MTRGSRHGPIAQLLIAWSPLSVILLAYALAEWVSSPIHVQDPGARTNRLGLDLHVLAPGEVDAHVFGVVPSVWLQHHLVGGSAHWYDAVAALVYVTHFVAIPVVTALVWFCLRERFRAWLAAVLVFTVIGVGGYVLYPAAPPWLASQQGDIGTVHRISGLGWPLLHLDLVGDLVGLGQTGGNPVAAMPSLHAGSALLVTVFLWGAVRRAVRCALVCYVVLMGLTLVYTGEHYVVDVAAGWLTAAVAVGVPAAVAGVSPVGRRGRRGRRARWAPGTSAGPPPAPGSGRTRPGWR